VTKDSTKAPSSQPTWDDPLVEALRPELRDVIKRVLAVELASALGAKRYERVAERLGYRHGSEERVLGTPMGPVSVPVPRARLVGSEGEETEWRSEKLPRHARRLRGIDRAVISIYLSGTNQRRIQGALRPLLKGLPLSKSSVSRLAARLRGEREAWLSRDLSEEKMVFTYLDGFGVNVRRDGRVVRNPVLLVIGVRETGEKVLLGMKLAGGESAAAWRLLLEDLTRRGLEPPVLAIIDGGSGLRSAVEAVWPEAAVQRCVVHKLRNLLAHAPRHAQESVREDYHRIVYATTEGKGRAAYERFVTRWGKRCAAVAASLQEGGEELLTFYRFPSEQWKSLRTTNLIERINEELRRRIKTQAAWAQEEALLSLLYGLFAGGFLRLRRIHGYRKLKAAGALDRAKAA
jgi:putative transposase